jgi:hypothetical protein
VISADHGHVLLPEVAAGDIVTAPPGTWLKAKRRCRLGSSLAGTTGTIVFRAADVGIHAPAEDICIPEGFKVFSAGESYFHEGISLQECVLPVIVVRVMKPAARQGKQEVTIQYRSDRFTSRVVGLKLRYEAGGLFGEPVRVKVKAHSGSGAKADVVGDAADCDARDEATHEVVLQPGVDTAVPVLIDPDFGGPSIEIRVTDPATGQIWARHKISNGLID